MEAIHAAWLQLNEDYRKGRTGPLRIRILANSKIDTFLAMDRPNGNRMLLVKSTAGSTETFKDREFNSRGLSIQSGGENNDRTLVLTLKNNEFHKAFDYLLDDIIEDMEHATNDAEAISICFARVENWKSMTESAKIEALSLEEQRGLIGELYFLQKYVLTQKRTDTIRCWKGPLGSAHDYQWSTFAVEVKTASTKEPRKVHISNELQLDAAGTDDLYMFLLSLAEHDSGKTTLPGLIAEIRLSLPTSLQDAFTEKLELTGYADRHEKQYLLRSYIIRGEEVFQVKDADEKFPCLTAKDLRPGLGDIKYTIQVSALEAFRIEPERITKSLEALNGK